MTLWLGPMSNSSLFKHLMLPWEKICDPLSFEKFTTIFPVKEGKTIHRCIAAQYLLGLILYNTIYWHVPADTVAILAGYHRDMSFFNSVFHYESVSQFNFTFSRDEHCLKPWYLVRSERFKKCEHLAREKRGTTVDT